MAKFISAREAADLIPDGATVAISGMGLSGWAEELGCAVRDRFKETGHPRDLHLKQDSAMGDWAVGQNFIGWDRNRREVPDTEHGARGSTRFGDSSGNGPALMSEVLSHLTHWLPKMSWRVTAFPRALPLISGERSQRDVRD